MVDKTIKGDRFKYYAVEEKNSTFTLHEDAFIHYGGKIDLSDLVDPPADPADMSLSLLAGYGIVEDIVTRTNIANNTYHIDGKVVGLLGAVTTFGDNTKIEIGKTGEVTAGLGIGVVDLAAAMSGGGLGSLTLGTVYAGGDKSSINIAKGGEVEGLIGVVSLGTDSSVTNAGTIETGLLGMAAGSIASLIPDPVVKAEAASGTSMVNNGYIDSAIGIFGLGEGLTLQNGKNGDIVAGAIGIGAFSLEGTTKITNAGDIRVTISLGLPEELEGLLPLSTAAIFGLEGKEVVKNTGNIFGDVFLGGGNDVFDSNGGKVDGDINLGAGKDTFNDNGGKVTGTIFGGTENDTYVLQSKVKIGEFDLGGIDTVKSSISHKLAAFVENLTLTGGGDTNATGNGGDNVLKGNKGDNVLEGKDGADTFIFATGGGSDRIADFVSGADKVDLSGWAAIADFATLQAKAKDVDGSVRIKVGDDVLVLDGVLEASLLETDFIFPV